MGLFDKIKNGINPEADPAYDDADLYTQQIQNDFQESQMYNTQQTQTQQQYMGQDQYAAPAQDDGMQVSGSSLELKVVKPERFDNVTQIANHLLNRRTVVLNLEETNKETARRLLDFLSGVAYSINGNLKRVANNTYVITPCNVDVSDGPLREKRQKEESSDYYENEI
ncbi:MAG: cell division protein SepF [Clostridia bacterium]|nr:cell division protein SepF [Clostridia bacterium]